MTKPALTPSPLALAAILAASAIPFTPAFAQEAPTGGATVPTEVAPPASAPVAPVVVQESPPIAPAPVTSVAPPVAAQPAPIASVPDTPAEAAPAPKASTARPVSRAVPSAARTAEPASGAAPSAATLPAAAPDAAPAPLAAEPMPVEPAPVAATPAKPADDGNGLLPIALAGLLIGGGAIGAASYGRRRKVVRREETPVAVTPVREPMPVAPPVAATDPVVTDPVMPEVRVKAADAPAQMPTPNFAPQPTSRSAERFHLPSGPIPSGAERLALIDRMAASPPDAANPFRAVRARRKRARMILTHAAQRQREAATQPFDYRTYQPSGAFRTDRQSEQVHG